MYLVVENTKDLRTAKMTPKLIELTTKLGRNLTVVSTSEELATVDREMIEGVILSGGPILLSEKSELFKYSKNFTALIEYPSVPVLGVCFGFQLLSVAHGGSVEKLQTKKEDLTEEIIVDPSSVLFEGLPELITVFQCHHDHVALPPIGFKVTGSAVDGTIQAVESIDRQRFGVQFHPENSDNGEAILLNFFEFCESS